MRTCRVREYSPHGIFATDPPEGRSGAPARAPVAGGYAGLLLPLVERLRPTPTADLLDTLPTRSDGYMALTAALDVWRELDKNGASIALIECESDDDDHARTFCITGVSRTAVAAVRAGDLVHAGFAFHLDEAGSLAVQPRTWRRDCMNGAVVLVSDGSDLVAHMGGVGEAMLLCFKQELLTEAIQSYTILAEQAVDDPARVLSDSGAVSAGNAEVLQRFWSEANRTLWGLLNAITIEAKRARTWKKRLEQERDAARLVARFAPMRSSFSGSA